MRSFSRRSRDALVFVLIALACTGGTFTCDSDDDGDKVVVDGRVNT